MALETAKDQWSRTLAIYQHILATLPYAGTVDKVEDLLPWNVELKKALVS